MCRYVRLEGGKFNRVRNLRATMRSNEEREKLLPKQVLYQAELCPDIVIAMGWSARQDSWALPRLTQNASGAGAFLAWRRPDCHSPRHMGGGARALRAAGALHENFTAAHRAGRSASRAACAECITLRIRLPQRTMPIDAHGRQPPGTTQKARWSGSCILRPRQRSRGPPRTLLFAD